MRRVALILALFAPFIALFVLLARYRAPHISVDAGVVDAGIPDHGAPPAPAPTPTHRFGSSAGHLKRQVNFIDGTDITTTVVDNDTTGQADVTIASTVVGGVSSVTSGGGSITVSPTTGAVVVSSSLPDPVTVAHGGTSDTTLPAANLLVGNGTSPVTGLAPNLNGNIACVSSGAWIAGCLPLTAGQGATGVSNPTAHDVPIAEGTNPYTFISPITSGFVLTSNGTGADPSFQPLSTTPSSIISGINHGTPTGPTTSYATFASVTLTVNGGLTATIDCKASLQWAFTFNTGPSSQLNWGISQDSTAAPTDVRILGENISGTYGGAMVESYAGTSAGSHTYRVLVNEQNNLAGGQSSAVTADLLCLQH
jgi:hypothetical protein